jgi:hypothetical protein
MLIHLDTCRSPETLVLKKSYGEHQNCLWCCLSNIINNEYYNCMVNGHEWYQSKGLIFLNILAENRIHCKKG